LEILKTDILIIGGGSAGCLAAIKAKDETPNLDITIVEKAHIRRSGSLATGMDCLNVTCIPDSEYPPEKYMEQGEWIEARDYLDEKLHYILAKKSYGVVKDLEKWGIKFAKVDGKYQVKEQFLEILDSQDLKVTLAAQVAKRGVQVINHTMITSLLSNSQKIYGATALNIRDGTFSTIQAKSIVLTTGSCGRFGIPSSGYLFGTFDFPGNAGDGFAMAYKIGAELTNFEYLKYHYYTAKDLHAPLGKFYLLPNENRIKTVDSEGKEVDRWVPPTKEGDQPTGKAPLFIDASHLGKHEIKILEDVMFRSERKIAIKQYFEDRGLKLGQDLIELRRSPLAICGGHGISGLVTDENAGTTVEGLYAAGDVAAVGIQYLSGAFVFGGIAGISASKYALRNKHVEVNKKEVGQYKEKLFEPYEREEGLLPSVFEFKLRTKIRDYITPPTNEKKSKLALKWIRRFRKEDLPLLVARDFHELARAVEAGFILDCAEIAAHASLEKRIGSQLIIKRDMKTGNMKIRRYQLPRREASEVEDMPCGGEENGDK
jgi:succinate dehydrogenase/fumarate reductase flavoprotein subunit